MTHLKLSALLLGATALTLPLGTSAYAQQQQGQQQPAAQQGQQQQAATQQGQEMGACERLIQILREANEEDLLENFRNTQQTVDQGDNEACALVIREVEAAGGISEQAVAERRGIQVQTERETFRASDTVSETVQVEVSREAIVEGEVLIRQPIPQVDIEQGAAEVQVSERPGRINIEEQPASILVRQQAANVRVSVPRPTVLIEQPAPEIIVTMPAPGVSVERDQPQVDVVVAEPTIRVVQEDPQVEVNVDARLVDEGEIAALGNNQPRIQTRAQRIGEGGREAQEDAEVVVRKVKPSIRFMTTDVQDEVRFSRAQPQIRYEAAEPNVEVTFNDEPRVEVRQVGEPRVRIRREGEEQSQATMQGQQGQQGQQAQQQNRQQAQQGGQQMAMQTQQGQQQNRQQGQQMTTQGQQSGQSGNQFTGAIAQENELVLRVDRRIQSASLALEQQDSDRARSEIERAGRSIDQMMQQADNQTQQELQGLRDQLDMVVVALEEQDVRGAETALYDVETNLQQNRNRWLRIGGDQQANMQVEREGVVERTVEGTAGAIGTGVAAVGSGVREAGQEVGLVNRGGERLSIEDTNRLLRAEEGQEYGQAQLTRIRAGDLRGADVHTIRGEEVGDVDEIVTAGGRMYAIVSHGGFLGIGEDQVAIPLERLAMRGNEVVLLGLTEEQLEAMPNYDFNRDQAFSANEEIEIGRFQ